MNKDFPNHQEKEGRKREEELESHPLGMSQVHWKDEGVSLPLLLAAVAQRNTTPSGQGVGEKVLLSPVHQNMSRELFYSWDCQLPNNKTFISDFSVSL